MMPDVADSLIYQVAENVFGQMADQLRNKLESLPPSGNSAASLSNLYQEFRRDYTIEASDLCVDAWRTTLHGIVSPMVAALPISIQRVLYMATENGGEECVSVESAEDITMSGPWIEETIIGRLHQ